jgi:hypothetical protein
MSSAVIAASRVLELKKLVARVEPFHCTTELDTKPVPDTINVKALPPAFVEAGSNELIAGPCAYALPACRSAKLNATATNPLPIDERCFCLLDIIGLSSFEWFSGVS